MEFIMSFIHEAFRADLEPMRSTNAPMAATDRLVTTQLLMSLIGATVVQVGIATIAIVSYLFPRANKPT